MNALVRHLIELDLDADPPDLAVVEADIMSSSGSANAGSMQGLGIPKLAAAWTLECSVLSAQR
jgi:hypothetical protein